MAHKTIPKHWQIVSRVRGYKAFIVTDRRGSYFIYYHDGEISIAYNDKISAIMAAEKALQ
jgi:hypothetical protein